MRYFGFDRSGFDLKTLGFGLDEFNLESVFADGQQGTLYEPWDLSTLWQDAAGTIPVTANGDPVRVMLDKSGNGNHAVAPSSAARPVYRTDGLLHWLEFDGVDDELLITCPVQSNSILSAAIKSNRVSNSFVFGSLNRSAKIGLFGSDAFFRLVTAGEAITIPQTLTDKYVLTGGRVSGLAYGRMNRIESRGLTVSSTLQTNWSTLGSANLTGQYFFGALYGAVILDAYSTDKVDNIEFYLAAKAGITL